MQRCGITQASGILFKNCYETLKWMKTEKRFPWFLAMKVREPNYSQLRKLIGDLRSSQQFPQIVTFNTLGYNLAS